MGKIIKGIGRIVGPLEGLLGTTLVERDKRKAAETALEQVTAAAAVPEPVEPSVPVMPLRNDATAVTAKRKSVAAQRTRKGRRSTILTSLDDNEGVLGA